MASLVKLYHHHVTVLWKPDMGNFSHIAYENCMLVHPLSRDISSHLSSANCLVECISMNIYTMLPTSFLWKLYVNWPFISDIFCLTVCQGIEHSPQVHISIPCCCITFNFNHIFHENYVSVEILSAGIFVPVFIKESHVRDTYPYHIF
jgi:hypothetical protein